MSFAVSTLMRDFKGGNHVTGANVGDSRVKLGKEEMAEWLLRISRLTTSPTQPAAEGRRKATLSQASAF
jgi:hypothetical protein